MRKKTNPVTKIMLGLVALGLLAVALYFVPPIHAKLAWRLDDLRVRIIYFLHPPENVTFHPSGQSFSTLTPDLFIPTSTLTPTITPIPTELATSTTTSTPIPETSILSNFVFVDQMGRYNYCGPSNLAMALEYWGWKGNSGQTLEPRDQIGAVVKPGVSDPNLNFVERSKTDVNVMPNELVDFVNENTTYKALFRYGGDTDLLKRLIVAGFPPITERGIYEILSPESTIQWGGHYAFTTGYDDSKQEFVWQDSYLPKPNSVGKNTRMSYSDYIQGWRAFDYVFIVVYPADREADLLQVLGPWADSNWAAQHALDITNSEIPTLTGNDLFFAWFNKGTSYGLLTDYGNAALAYDYAYNSLYPNLPKTETEPLPYRIMWYQTGPYKAYFYTSRYQAVIDMADSNLKTPVAPKTLEESLFWRAMAEYTLGETDQAVADMRQALYYHPGFQSALDMMAQWGVNP